VTFPAGIRVVPGASAVEISAKDVIDPPPLSDCAKGKLKERFREQPIFGTGFNCLNCVDGDYL
jgi:hypothetical protein